MDYVYGKLDNNLVDINRIEYIRLKKCDTSHEPIDSLEIGDYYLETKIVDSDKIIYTDLSGLNKDDEAISAKLEQEVLDRTTACDTLSINIKNEAARTDNMINQLNENVHSQFTQLNKILVDSINTINGGIEEERRIREESDNTLQSNLDAESKRVDSMINTVNNNVKTIVDQLNQNIAVIVATINTNIDNESKERLKQDTLLDERITKEIAGLESETNSTISALTETVNKNKEEINTRVDQEVATLSSSISATRQDLQSLEEDVGVLDSMAIKKGEDESFVNDLQTSLVIRDASGTGAASLYGILKLDTTLSNGEVGLGFQRQGASVTTIGLQYDSAKPAISDLTDSYGYGAGWKTIAIEDQVSEEKERALAAENALTVSFNNALKQEEDARVNADNDLSTRIGNLEGKTTRLYYGEGTLSSPTAAEIQSFITNLEVDPPYEPPYSGIAAVVKLTDENTYHIWHYYANLSSWKDDGVDLVTSFTNTSAGIITGTTSVGYIGAVNGYGKVNGWEELTSTTSSNYTTLNNKIDSSVSTINGTISSLSTRLDGKIDTEISDRISAISSLSSTFTASLNSEISRAQQAEEALATTISTSVSMINQTISTLCTSLTSSIEAETQRATAKENEIISSLSLETQERLEGDNTLSQVIADETARAQGVESSLSATLTSTTSSLNNHISNLSNPHQVTKSQIGLGSVINAGQLSTPTLDSGAYFTAGGAYTLQQGLLKSIEDAHTSQQLSGVDLNECTSAQYKFYWGSGGNNCTNKPDSVDAFGMLSFRTASGYYCQLIVGANNSQNTLFVRTLANETWTNWVEYSKVGHTHTIANITNLQSTLDDIQGKLNSIDTTLSSLATLNFEDLGEI